MLFLQMHAVVQEIAGQQITVGFVGPVARRGRDCLRDACVLTPQASIHRS
jgi:hypothetical protein